MRDSSASPRCSHSTSEDRQPVSVRLRDRSPQSQDPKSHGARVAADLALPDPHYLPAMILCELTGGPIAFGITDHLVCPELGVGAGPRRFAAVLWATVPEAPVDKDGQASPGEDEVGGTALGDLRVQAEPPAGCVHRLSEHPLRRRVHLPTASKMGALGRAHPFWDHGRNPTRELAARPGASTMSRAVLGRPPPADDECYHVDLPGWVLGHVEPGDDLAHAPRSAAQWR